LSLFKFFKQALFIILSIKLATFMFWGKRIIGCSILLLLAVGMLFGFYYCFSDYGFWTLLYIPETIVLLMCLYVLLPALLFFAGRSKINKSFISTLAETDTEKNYFTLLVPAHNEERLLPLLLHSLQDQTYSKEHYQVVVIADNCKDNTATIAQMFHAHCLERFSGGVSNKHEALEYAIENFTFSDKFNNGYVCVVDADCEAHPDFLREMNHQLVNDKSVRAIQSYRYVANARESNITLLDSAGEALRNWAFSAPRKLIGASVFGNGSGVLFTKDLFEKLITMPGSHLAEDKEWNAYLSMHHIKIDYCATARLGYEAVSLKKDFQKQRRRWISSHISMIGTYSVKMFTQSILNLNAMQFDCFCALMQIPRSLLIAFCCLFGLLSFLLPQSSFLPHGGWLIVITALILYGLLGLYLIKARKKDYLAIFSVFELASGVIKTTFISIFGRRVSEWRATRTDND
jgi:cellulose synthase/poly-beta-1,6-N-acetylglucosamine synthase-like glycosyltransferase